MKNHIRTLASWRNWELICWSWSRRFLWNRWWPGTKRFWSGKLTHYTFGPFELVRDGRGGQLGILADMMGVSKKEAARKLSGLQQAEREEESDAE